MLRSPPCLSITPHFLLSAAARSLSLREVFALSDEAAFGLFREVRWGADGVPVCPACGVLEAHWFLPSRRQCAAARASTPSR
jgi:hypothetical protein